MKDNLEDPETLESFKIIDTGCRGKNKQCRLNAIILTVVTWLSVVIGIVVVVIIVSRKE